MSDERQITGHEAPRWYWRWVSRVAPTWRREVAYWGELYAFGLVIGFILSRFGWPAFVLALLPVLAIRLWAR